MADEPAAPEAPETTGTPPEAPAAPPEAPAEGQTESPEVDWQKRYEDQRSEFDRRGTLVADIEGRNGPEKQEQALAEHARIELEAEEEGEEPEEEFDLRDPIEEVDKVRLELAERDEVAKAAEFDQLEKAYTEETVEALEDSEGFKLTDEEYDFVVNRGLANRDQFDGKPDLEGSFKAFKDAVLARKKEVAEGKDTEMPPLGTTGEPKIDLKDKDARQKLGREVFEAAERSKQT